jgi:hypothetical protein
MYDPERYREFKKHRICPHCKGDPAPGKVYCQPYIDYQVQQHKSPARKAYMVAYLREYRRRNRRRLTERAREWRRKRREAAALAGQAARAAAIPRPSIYEFALGRTFHGD